MHYAYIVKCADGTLYTGSSSNVLKRVREHNTSKKGAHYTKIRRPVALVYSEKCDTLGSARKREHEIKRLTRKEKMRLISTD